jgi:N-acetylglutamate synthase-like GNAT family acetyltransferase
MEAAYPGSAGWMTRRLAELRAGTGRCLLARDEQGLCALAIQVPKGEGRIKLCSLWVREDLRRQGLGGALIERCLMGWHQDGAKEVYVTANEKALPFVAGLLTPRGFRIVASCPDRYRDGEVETVLRLAL